MAQNYTRQSAFSNGDTITATLFNDEYNQLVNTFIYSSSDASATGHRHDGSTGQGGNIYRIGDLDFLNKIEADSSNNRWGFWVEVSSIAVEQLRIQDGALVPVTDNDIDLGTSSLEFKNLYLDGTAKVDTLVVDETATITGAATLSSDLTVTGNTTLNGNTTIGNAATDTVTITADVSSNIIPSADSTYTLGDSSNYWSAGYIDALTTTGNVSVGGNLTVTGNATISGNLTFGDADTDTVSFSADVSSHILPDVTNTYDLGSVTKQWRNLYVDGTANIDSLVADTVDINGGTIDGVTIGGASAGAGTFTTLQADTSLNVDGTVTADGGTFAGATSVEYQNPLFTLKDTVAGGSSGIQFKQSTDAEVGRISTTDADLMRFYTGSAVTKRIEIGSGGDISFYENTGTTAKFFWDASAESLEVDGQIGITNFDALKLGTAHGGGASIAYASDGNLKINPRSGYSTIFESGDVGIGTTPSSFNAAANNLVVGTTSGSNGVTIVAGAASQGSLFFADGTATSAEQAAGYLIYLHSSDSMAMGTANTEAMRINSSGNVGIGTSLPANILTVSKSSSDVYSGATLAPSNVGNSIFIDNVDNTIGSFGQIVFRNGSSGQIFNRIASVRDASGQGSLAFVTGSSSAAAERMRIDASGNVGIGRVPTSVESAYDSIQLGAGGIFLSGSSNLAAGNFGQNYYVDAVGNTKYLGDDEAERIIMNNGYIAFENAPANTSGAGAALTFNERMRITSAGDVGIGTSSPGRLVDLKVSSNNDGARLRLRSATAIDDHPLIGSVEFYSDDNSTDSSGIVGSIDVEGTGTWNGGANNAAMTFNLIQGLAGTTSPVEAMRIDSSGNLIVGKSSADNTTAGTTIYGAIGPGAASFVRDSGNTLVLNRLNTDGEILAFRKDGTTVGSIGSSGGDMYVGTGDTGVIFNDFGNQIRPTNAGSTNDATIDIGANGHRFKDLYLSGGVYLGGTGAANLLDDYEEGTFTPVFADDATAGNTATGGIYGHYTKKGREVTLLLGAGNIDTTGMTAGNILYVRGLPFTSSSLAGFVVATGSMRASSVTDGSSIYPYITEASTYLRISRDVNASLSDELIISDLSSGSSDLYMTITYFV